MNNTEKTHQQLANSPLTQPLAIRYFLWLAIGKALRLPVAELIESINIQLAAAKRARGNKRAPFTDHERMRLAELGKAIGKPIYSLYRWMVSPDALIRWLKRYQERQVQQQKGTEHIEKPKGRPSISQDKVEAITRIYRSGLIGIKRIQGEMRKCGYDIARSSIRKVLDTQGLPPGSNSFPGSSWMAFWRNHAPDTIGIDFVQTAVGLFGKVTYRFVLIAIEHDTRKTHLLGITEHLTDFWLRNVIAAATMDGEPLANKKHWVHDNDGKFQTLPDISGALNIKQTDISIFSVFTA